MQPFGHLHKFAQQAVHPGAYLHAVQPGLNVDVAGAHLDPILDDEVEQFDHRGKLRLAARVSQGDFLFVPFQADDLQLFVLVDVLEKILQPVFRRVVAIDGIGHLGAGGNHRFDHAAAGKFDVLNGGKIGGIGHGQHQGLPALGAACDSIGLFAFHLQRKTQELARQLLRHQPHSIGINNGGGQPDVGNSQVRG